MDSLFLRSALIVTSAERGESEGLTLLVELDVVVLEEAGPVLGEHVLGAHTDQPAPGGALRAGQARQATNAGTANNAAAGNGYAMGGVHPGGTALDVEQGAVGDNATDAARNRGQPVALGGAGQENHTGRRSLDVHSGDVTLNAEHDPAVLPVISDLPAAQEAAPAVLGERKRERDRTETGKGCSGQGRFGGSPTAADMGTA